MTIRYKLTIIYLYYTSTQRNQLDQGVPSWTLVDKRGGEGATCEAYLTPGIKRPWLPWAAKPTWQELRATSAVAGSPCISYSNPAAWASWGSPFCRCFEINAQGSCLSEAPQVILLAAVLQLFIMASLPCLPPPPPPPPLKGITSLIRCMGTLLRSGTLWSNICIK